MFWETASSEKGRPMTFPRSQNDLEALISLSICLDNHLRERWRERARSSQSSGFPDGSSRDPEVEVPGSSTGPMEPTQSGRMRLSLSKRQKTFCKGFFVLWIVQPLHRLLSALREWARQGAARLTKADASCSSSGKTRSRCFLTHLCATWFPPSKFPGGF